MLPGSVSGVGVPARRWGACLAAGAYQTTGKCQCLRGHLSPAPRSRPPSAYHRRAQRCSTAQGRRAWPGGAGRVPFRLCLFPSPLRLLCFGVVRPVKSLHAVAVVAVLSGAWGKESWSCRQLVPFHRSFSQLWPLTPPQVLFFLFLALIGKSTARGQLARIWVRLHTTLSQLVKGLKIMGKFSRHLQDMVAVATGLLIW